MRYLLPIKWLLIDHQLGCKCHLEAFFAGLNFMASVTRAYDEASACSGLVIEIFLLNIGLPFNPLKCGAQYV